MSLDDFFAKKNKKKIKGQKFTCQEDMARKIEEKEKKEEKLKETFKETPIKKIVERNGDVNEDQTDAHMEPIENPDQWNDFEDKVEVDVSDLKITNLNTQDDENAGSDANDDNDSNCGENKKDSVWKVEPQEKPSICDAMDSALEAGQDAKATVAAMTAAKWTASSTSSDAMQPAPLPRGPGAGGNRKKKAAPDLKNEDAFPTLGNKPKRKQQSKKTEEAAPTPTRGVSGKGAAAAGIYVPPSYRSRNRYGGLTDQSSKW